MTEKSHLNECSICLELLTDRTKDLGLLECNHKFHMECLYEWFSEANSNFKCPNCFVQRDIVAIIPKEGTDINQIQKKSPKSMVRRQVRRRLKKKTAGKNNTSS